MLAAKSQTLSKAECGASKFENSVGWKVQVWDRGRKKNIGSSFLPGLQAQKAVSSKFNSEPQDAARASLIYPCIKLTIGIHPSFSFRCLNYHNALCSCS